MVDLVLHHARVEAFDVSLESSAALVVARIPEFPKRGTQPRMPGTERQPSQPSSSSPESGVSTGLMRTVSGTGSMSG